MSFSFSPLSPAFSVSVHCVLLLCVYVFFFPFSFILPHVWNICQVAALLLLSQQEERHFLERNVNAALQRKMEELQRNLLQVISVKCLFLALQLHDFYSILPVETSDIMCLHHHQIDEKEIYVVAGSNIRVDWDISKHIIIMRFGYMIFGS